jgi:hypothetical protein
MAAPRTLNPGGDLAPPIKPGPDVYLGLLVISLIAQLAAVLFLWMDRSQYPDKTPPKVSPPQSVGGAPAQPAAPAGGALGAPGGGAIGGQPGQGAIGGAPGGAAPPGAAPPASAAPPGAAPPGGGEAAPPTPSTAPKK